MKLPFLSNNKDSKSKPSALWRWPSCNQPETHSFHNTMFKTINSAYIDTHTHNDDDSFLFTSSSPSGPSPSIATTMIAEAEEEYGSGDSLEKVIRDIRSEKTERLFFEAGETNSILEQGTNKASISGFPSVFVSMESHDPLLDFKKSMEEMVEANGIKDFNGLEELYNCYLRVNEKRNHEYVVGAFIHLLVSLDFHSSSSHCNGGASPCSPFSVPTSSSNGDSSLTPCSSSMEPESVINREEDSS